MEVKKIFISLVQASFFFGGSQSQVVDIPVVAAESYKGQYAKGTMRIMYANGRQFTKPFIVVEGFDPGCITAPEEKFGRRSIEDFLKVLGVDTNNLSASLLGDLSGYDIIYIDFNNGTDYLQRNARLVEEVIRYVNANKSPVDGVIQPNIILGKSMGSILARYALRRMENNYPYTKEAHNTWLYISLDGGQQGSNIPQGYQHMANHMRAFYVSTGPTASMVEKISLLRRSTSPMAKLGVTDQPASRQLTINHIDAANKIDNSMHDDWLAELQEIGYPRGDGLTPFEKIAISNGSESAEPQQVGNAGDLLTWKGKAHTSLFSDIAGISGLLMAGIQKIDVAQSPLWFTLGNLPGRNQFIVDLNVAAKAENKSNELYHAKITYRKKILGIIPVEVVLTDQKDFAISSTPAYDYYPGGYQDITDDMAFVHTKSNILFKTDIVFKSLPACHVPVVSALDIGAGTKSLTYKDYFTKYNGSSPPVGARASPFQAFITALNNESHTAIEQRNGEWLATYRTGDRATGIWCGSIAMMD